MDKYHHLEFSGRELEFLDLFKIAARYDCLYLLQFYCFDMYDHDRITALDIEEQAALARAARGDIYEEAVSKGYEPPAWTLFGGVHDRVC
ncbi:hypothetical protein JM93_01260 [Roseibium hamelinense]|uniref:Uncharacterized protein n=1 Tax=Roseibium hamelinense TaxID=150831 RepID=A0A562TBP1_9HYPH|nr:hypothetical protein [Roseibium hamelinense]MTI45353.1 hypothetical protein [Roseibium hamelinense]TWI90280.1 hypothetical protein JM93_01260 [Roseibium hamelinense]